ncbi:ankyrin [Xylaria sp. FL1777]|nr:ankyrin [Xylaria sp. FL1777]
MPKIGVVNPSGSRPKPLGNGLRRLRFPLAEDTAGPSGVGPDPHETEKYATIIEDGTHVDDDSADEEILRPTLKFQAGVSRVRTMESMLDTLLSKDQSGTGKSHRKRPQFAGVTEETDTSKRKERSTSSRSFSEVLKEVAGQLVDERIDINEVSASILNSKSERKPDSEWKPIHFAAQKGNLGLIKAYVERGVDVDSREDDDWTPLIIAARVGQLEVCRLLLDLGADIDATNNEGKTALHGACLKGNTDVVQFLLERGTDVSIRNTGKCSTALIISAYEAHTEIIQLLLDYGADVNDSGEDMWTPLHFVVQFDKGLTLDVARLLIQEGADIDAVGTDGVTPLYLAVQAKRIDVVELLLTEGTKQIEQRTIKDNSALERAIIYSRLDMVDLLLRYGARTDLVGMRGFNIVHFAALQSNVDVMKRILEIGADIDLENTDGRNLRPLHLASGNENEEIALLLLERGAKL